ncbi:hypothetical protein M9H77_23192 [Catharanthus roseus]|uniref:Uncharacterized protein n=1 Tax=Catharanthus roseus TaxID=4058 RepID=A0ACC0AUR6_CATRO|nr:hypothetical protein M9H77_23192 [Catharanthus roseus]
MVAYMKEPLKSKIEDFEGQEKDFKLFLIRSIISTDGHLPTQSHQGETSDPTRMNLNETLRDVEELKKGKSSAIMEQRVGDNLGRVQARGGRRGGLGGRRYHRPQEEFPRYEAWHGGNLYEDYGDNPNIGQAYHGGYYGNQQGDKALDKIKWKVPSFKASTYKSWPKKKDTPKVSFKDHSKPKVQEKGKLITNPTRYFKCNGVGHIAINCATKRTLLFNEDLKGRIEKSNDDYQEGHHTTDGRPTPTVGGRLLPALPLEHDTYHAR